LELAGYEVLQAEDGKKALEILSENPDIRLLITDLAMPVIDGYELIKAVRENELHYTYIIVLTSMDDRRSMLEALSSGADDYLLKPVHPEELKLRLKGGRRVIQLENQEELIFSMAKLSEYRSEETGFHLERVTHYTKIIARDLVKNHSEFELSLSMADEISKVSPLHDIGKVAIPDKILHKPGKLDSDEWVIMKTHTNIGGNLLQNIYNKQGNSYYLWLGYEIAMFHHEKWNGSGYPNGLAGNQIPLSARIMAIADVYDALTSRRCYKEAFSHDFTSQLILGEKGKQFDPRVVDSFIRQEDAFLEVKEKFKD
jgi:putative two-component system response regulator